MEVILEVKIAVVCKLSCCRFAAQPTTVVLTDHANALVIAAQAPVGIETRRQILGTRFIVFQGALVIHDVWFIQGIAGGRSGRRVAAA